MASFKNSLFIFFLLSWWHLADSTVCDNFKECSQFFYMHTAPTGIRGGSLRRICQRYGDKLRYATLYDSSRRMALYSAYTFKKSDGQRTMDTPWLYEPQVHGISLVSPWFSNIVHLKFYQHYVAFYIVNGCLFLYLPFRSWFLLMKMGT